MPVMSFPAPTSSVMTSGRAPSSRAAMLALALLPLQGCAALFTPPSVDVVGVELVTLGLTSGTAEVILDVTNKASRETTIRGLRYNIEVRNPGDGEEWATLSDGFFSEEVLLPGKQTKRVSVPISFEYEAIGAAVRSFLTRGEVPYRLNGDVWLGRSGVGVQVPFRDRGVLKP